MSRRARRISGAQRRYACYALLVAFALLAPSSRAHDPTPAARPSPEELASVEPPLPGAIDFARALLVHGAGWATGGQGDGFTRLDAHLAAMAAATSARDDAKIVAFHRWQAERALREIVAGYPGVVTLSGTPSGAAAAPVPQVDVGASANQLLVRVPGGNGPPRFTLQTLDLLSEFDRSRYVIEADAAGATWVLLTLEHVPEGASTIEVDVRPAGAVGPGTTNLITVVAPPWGQLAIDVRDETGAATPVLLRLTSVVGRRVWEPPNAVDLRPMMADVMGLPTITGTGRGHTVYPPAANPGVYWVVPGPFDMALPAGNWEVDVLHGPEYTPVHETLAVAARQWTRRQITLTRMTDMPQRGWYSGDDHVHARLMSSADTSNLLAYARATDVHVCNVLEMGDPLRTYYTQRGFGPEFRAHTGTHWLIPGQEDPRSPLGHVIGLNLRERVRDPARYLAYDEIAAEIHRQGGLYGHAHASDGACDAARELALITPTGAVDFTAVMQNSLGTTLLYDLLNLGLRMTLSAGTDSPQRTIGAVRVYAYTGTAQAFTPDVWFDAMRAGHTFVTNGPMLEFWVDDAMPGDEIAVDADRPVQVRARAWGRAGTSAPARLEIVRLGEVARAVEAERAEQDTLEVNLTVPAGYGFWIAAHAVAQDGTEAHSTPVYVVRKGFRTWNVDRAGEVIDRQLAALTAIDAAVAKAGPQSATAAPGLAESLRRIAAQRTATNQRVAQARDLYQQLRLTLAAERTRRSATVRPSGVRSD